MTQAGVNKATVRAEDVLPRHDWILLPLISILTISILIGSTEFLARRIFPEPPVTAEDCMEFHDPITGIRGKPNAVCIESFPESELTEYRFNNCGHRAGMECGTKPPGTYRIVLIGTSIAMGMRLPREKSFAALLPPVLSQRTGHPIEIYNEAMPYRTPDIIASHFDDVLRGQPDMILWVLSSGDMIVKDNLNLAFVNNRKLSLWVRAWRRFKEVVGSGSMVSLMKLPFAHSRITLLLSHYLNSSPFFFVRASLNLEPYQHEPSAERKKRLAEFDENADRVIEEARQAGIPLVAVLLPDHAQTGMMLLPDMPTNVDPYWQNQSFREIFTRDGATYLDVFPDVRTHPALVSGYFPSDGHPNASGNAIFAEILAQHLENGPLSMLKENPSGYPKLERNR
jgi:hypothetical protein